jgi:hypothetical protein
MFAAPPVDFNTAAVWAPTFCASVASAIMSLKNEIPWVTANAPANSEPTLSAPPNFDDRLLPAFSPALPASVLTLFDRRAPNPEVSGLMDTNAVARLATQTTASDVVVPI